MCVCAYSMKARSLGLCLLRGLHKSGCTSRSASTHQVFNMATEDQYLSQRGKTTKNTPNVLNPMGARLRQNAYDKDSNPQGIINLGRVDNTLMEDILLEKLKEPKMNELEPYMLYYSEYRGTAKFRETIAEFMTDKFQTCKPVNAENLICTSGVGAALDLMSHVLADPGDCFITPTPFYTRIKTDIGERSFSQLRGAHLYSTIQKDYGATSPWELYLASVETAFEEAVKSRQKVRGIILLNPSNPTGDIYSPEMLQPILEFAKGHKLHVIMDEIYALTVFGEGATFKSVLAMPNLPDPMRTHVLWGFSKDFCLSGFRVGVIHSWNSHVLQAILPLCYFGSVPSLAQHRLTLLMKDRAWFDQVFHPTNISRLSEAYNYSKGILEKFSITVHPAKAGLFIWIDMTKYINPLTEEGEMKLFELFMSGGVCIFPGCYFFGQEAGWFRLVFSHKRELLSVGMDRLVSVLKKLDDSS